MNGRIILILVQKDVTLHVRNRFFVLITALSLLVYLAIYYLMPATAEAKFQVGIYPPDVPALVRSELEARDMEVAPFDTEDALKTAVEAGDYRAGLVLPANVMALLAAGEPTRIVAYYPPGIPEDLNRAFNDLLMLVFNGISYEVNEQPLNIDRHEEILGYDLAGESIPPRDRLLPIFAMFLFMTETLALANLIAEEAARGTLRALLITPMNVRDLFVGKSITGIGIGVAQAALLLAVTGSLGWQPLLVLLALLLGALLVTGVGFLIASAARDIMSVLSWGTLAIIVLGIPAVSIMFPGTIAGTVRLIPSYYLVDTLHRLINFNAGWNDVVANLAVLFVAGVAMLALGTTVLRRKLT